jgi:hypothetical protein
MEQTRKASADVQDAIEGQGRETLSLVRVADAGRPESEVVARSGALEEATAADKLDICNILAGLLYGVSPRAFADYSRHGRHLIEARQLGLYLANTCLSLSYEYVAEAARRDRTTVRYSVERVEDRRENLKFDAVLMAMETLIGCLRDQNVADMIENGLEVDFERIAWVPLSSRDDTMSEDAT